MSHAPQAAGTPAPSSTASPRPLMRQVLMGLAGAGFLFLAFASLASQETRNVPLTISFIPVGIGLISGSRHMCWLGRAAMWVVMLFFIAMGVGLATGVYKTTASSGDVGVTFAVWVGLSVVAETLLRLRIQWSRAAR